MDGVRSLRKIPTRLCGTNYCTSLTRFVLSIIRQPKGSQMHLNSTKRTKMWVYGPMGQIGCFSCEKFWCDFVAWTFALVLSRFAPSFVRQPNSPKCTQIVENRPKHEFRVQWGGSGAIVATNSDVTLCYEHLHLFSLFCTEFHKPTKLSQMHPNSTKRAKTWLMDAMGWIGCVRCEKFRRDFVETNFLH